MSGQFFWLSVVLYVATPPHHPYHHRHTPPPAHPSDQLNLVSFYNPASICWCQEPRILHWSIFTTSEAWRKPWWGREVRVLNTGSTRAANPRVSPLSRWLIEMSLDLCHYTRLFLQLILIHEAQSLTFSGGRQAVVEQTARRSPQTKRFKVFTVLYPPKIPS